METFKKKDAAKAVDAIAQAAALHFGIETPTLGMTGAGIGWEAHCPGAGYAVEVWTKAGRAEFSVSIDSRFAHLYFRFDDPARAAQFDTAQGRLNRFSGKWNHLASPESYALNGKPHAATSLDVFVAECIRDFRKVAQPNPPADEVAAYRAKEAKRAAAWGKMMMEAAQ